MDDWQYRRDCCLLFFFFFFCSFTLVYNTIANAKERDVSALLLYVRFNQGRIKKRYRCIDNDNGILVVSVNQVKPLA
jgi:hypothetical protein